MVGQFFTPEAVARVMLRLAGSRPGQRIMDPSCGDGVFLRCCPPGCAVHGCEIDPRYAAVIKAISGVCQTTIDDALVALLPLWGSFDLAIGNPPFSAQTHLERRPQVLRGFDLGAGRPSQCLEVLFLELFVKLVKPRGRIAIILPDGPLSNRPFQFVRDWVLRQVQVQMIVSLPRGLFRETSAKTNIIIARRLPASQQPYREPTWMRVCGGIGELDTLKAPPHDHGWRPVILADASDWRPEAHEDAPMGANTDGIRLGDVCRLRTGFACYGAKRELFERPSSNRIPLLRAKNFKAEGGLRLDHDLAYVCRDGPMFAEDAVVRPGEVLFVRVGMGCYGRAASVPARLHAQADDWIHVLTPFARLDANGLADWLNSAEGRQQVSRLAKGVGALSVSKSSLAELRVPRALVNGSLVLSEARAAYGIDDSRRADRRAVEGPRVAPKARVGHPAPLKRRSLGIRRRRNG
ncbi:MAG: N-6 DNA methylase [Verrucomicrobiae bacterium]|nr:N-6 DNA methylase [Verrucomicrobiae bacterium]